MQITEIMSSFEVLKVIGLFALGVFFGVFFLWSLPMAVVFIFRSRRATNPVLKKIFRERAVMGILVPLIFASAFVIFTIILRASGLFDNYGA